MKQRIITGVILAVIAILGIVQLSAYYFAIASGVFMLPVAWEWARSFCRYSRLGAGLYVLLIGGLLLLNYNMASLWIVYLAAIGWVGALCLLVCYARGWISKIFQPLWPIFGVIVLLPAWKAAVNIQSYDVSLLLYVLIMIILVDAGAYFIGGMFGRHPLAVSISPNKTIEGLFGGMFSAIIGGSIFYYCYFAFWGWQTYIEAMLLTLIVVIFAVAGDLTESVFKRIIGIKDSGTILPGHGGLLDRLDSLLAVLPIFVVMGRYIGWM